MPKPNPHPYIPNAVPKVKEAMMKEIGVASIDELYTDIPQKFRLRKRLNLPQSSSEHEVKRHVEEILRKNKTADEIPVFLGAGCWQHYVPAAVDTIIQRSEFLTAYTPYQTEISQGMLQALFEYQSMICELTGMDVANCSMYDWASALGEAARMAARINHRTEILVPRIIHPERKATLHAYAEPAGLKIRQIDYDKETGQLDIEDLKGKISGETAAVYVENPSYVGIVESKAKAAAEIAHDKKALLIAGVEPISLGILTPPSTYDADIAIGEGQALGSHMNFGGPLLGIFACKDTNELIRQMPGRVIGLTTTVNGDEKGFCMALQTREQHIRREKATSNICSNEALCAVASAAYLALLGPSGLKQLAETITFKANYAARKLSSIENVKAPLFDAAHFMEFTVNFDKTGMTVPEIHRQLLAYGVHGGKSLVEELHELGQTALYCVTEVHSKEDIDLLAQTLEKTLRR